MTAALPAMRPRQPRRIFYGWWVVAASSGLTSLSVLFFYGFTLFFLPLSQQLGLNRAATSLVFSLSRVGGAFTSPFSGWTMDRLGPRTMLITGVLLAGVGFILLGTLVKSFLTLVLVYVFLIGMGFNLGFWQGALAAINQWFIRRRTLAMSIINAFSSGSGFVLVPLVAFVVLRLGWEWAAVFSGALVLGVGIPLAMMVRRSPESMGLRPDGDPSPSGNPSAVALARAGPRTSTPESDFTLREALRTQAFWLLLISNCFRALVWGAVAVHIVPALVWKGFGQQSASTVVAALSLMGMPLSLLIGVLGDRYNKRLLMVVGTLSGASALLLLAEARHPWQVYPYILLFAIMDSSSPLSWSLIGEYFGRKRFATLTGIMASALSLSLAVGPVFAGWVFDKTGSYRLALLPLAGGLVFSALLYVPMRRPEPRRSP